MTSISFHFADWIEVTREVGSQGTEWLELNATNKDGERIEVTVFGDDSALPKLFGSLPEARREAERACDELRGRITELERQLHLRCGQFQKAVELANRASEDGMLLVTEEQELDELNRVCALIHEGQQELPV